MATLEQIEKQISALTAKLDKLLSPSDSPYTLYNWLDDWYTLYKVPKLKPSSLYQIRNCIKLHIKRHLGDMPLDRITALDIEKALAQVKTTRMRKYAYDTLNDSLRQAHKKGIIPVNPMDNTDGVIHRRKNGHALTSIQQMQFLSLVKGHELYPLYVFYLLTGCRKSEALAVKWTDVDYDQKRIHIQGTKTTGSDRYVPLFPEISELLLSVKHIAEQVFPYSANQVYCHFRRIKAKHKLPYTIHDLRHTFATRCLESGISYSTVQKWLGHAQASTTLNIYTHVQTAFELAETAKFDPKM